MKIKKGDKVQVMLGKDRGKTGTVDQILLKSGKVLVGGLNIYKKHLKPRGEGDKNAGGIVDKSRPFLAGKVMIICPKCSRVTRLGHDEQKQRICRKCKAVI